MKECINCKNGISDEASFCTHCGTKQGDIQDIAQNNQVIPPPPPGQNLQNPDINASPVNENNKKKGRGCLKGCLIAFIAFLLLTGMLVAALYFLLPGLIPGVFAPADFGIEVSRESYMRAHEKLGYSKDSSPESDNRDEYTVIYSGSREVNTSLTSEEITSMLGYNRSAYTGFYNPQVRINSDGTVDISVNFDLDYMFRELLLGDFDSRDMEGVIPFARRIPDNVNFHGNFEARVTDNSLQITSLNSARVQGLPIPSSLLDSSVTHRFIEDRIDRYIAAANERTGSSYDLIEVRNEEIVIVGVFPESITRVRQ